MLQQELKKEESQLYLEQFILPAFRGMVTQDLFCTIYDCEGKVVFATNKAAHVLGLENAEAMCGYSYKNAYMENAAATARDKGTSQAQIVADYKAIYELQQLVVKHKKPLKYLDLMPHQGELRAHMVFLVPFFHPNGAVVGYQSLAQEYMFYGIQDFLATIQGSQSARSHRYLSSASTIKLAPRQQEILFLISQGVTQNIAAKILCIKRGSISKIISEQLCPKFEINPPCTQDLINKAVALGFNKIIPNGLRKRHLIVLDSDTSLTCNDIYFNNPAKAI